MEVLKILKGGSLSKTQVILDGTEKFVRKSISTTSNREYGMVRWHSQIRKLQILNKYIPGSSVSIKRVGWCEEFYFYDIPYYEHCLNCYEALLNGESVSNIADKVHLLLSKMAAIQYGVVKGSLSVYIAEEILFPLKTALEIDNKDCLSLSAEEMIFFKEEVKNAIAIVEHLLTEVKDVCLCESLTHGNLTLENMLWNIETNEIVMIDPYAETYCESIIGDISQLLQSSKSGYEYISNIYEKKDVSIYHYPSDKIPECLINFSDQLIEKISSEIWFSDIYLNIFRASQFTRMFPFKMVNSPRQGVAFMLHGISLMRKI